MDKLVGNAPGWFQAEAPDFVVWSFELSTLAGLMEDYLRSRYGLQAEEFLTLQLDDEDPAVCLAYLDEDLFEEDFDRMYEDGLEVDDSYQLFQQLIEAMWHPDAFAEGCDGNPPRVRVFVPFKVYRAAGRRDAVS
ncbi:MAG: hypothetical protein ACPLRW_05565 [Moorellales bacterium]